jgi:hypothetical protein
MSEDELTQALISAYRRRDAVAKERQALVGRASALEREAFILQGRIDLLEEQRTAGEGE